MKIQAIKNANNTGSQTQNLNKNFNQPSFKGYVNGKFYDDWIIQKAKSALKDPSWEKTFRKNQNYLNEYLKWHEAIEDQGGLKTRVISGIFSFGATEVLMGGLTLIAAAIDDTEKVINNVKDCMIDLLKSGE